MGSSSRRARRLRRRLRRVKPLLVLLALLVVASLAWSGIRGALAARELLALNRDLVAVQTEASTQKTTGRLDLLVASASDHGRHAASLTGDPVWRLWSHAPLIGSTLRVVTGISQQARVLADTALPPLLASAHAVPGMRKPDGSLDVSPLTAQAPGLRTAASALAHAEQAVVSLPRSRFGVLERASEKLGLQLDQLRRRTLALSVAADVGADVLGVHVPRRYLIAVQNNAEARASGGIVGAYGILSVAGGRPVLEKFGSDASLMQVDHNVIDPGPEWLQRYDPLGQARDWREVTATPDFPTAGSAMLGLWAATHFGEHLDGVLSVDPPALADILQATGPLTRSDGTLFASDTVVKQTLVDAYAKYTTKEQRSAVLTEDARAVFSALTKGTGGTLALGERLGHAVVTGHLKFYSAHPSVQAELLTTTIAGALPVDAAPYLSVITQAGNNDKLSYYLDRDIRYVGHLLDVEQDFGDGKGPQPQESGVLDITLRNTAPVSGLPDYVAPRTDATTGQPLAPGRVRLSVSVYLGRSGQLVEGRVNGIARAFGSETERGMAVLTTEVEIAPGGSVSLQLSVLQPARPGAPLTLVQQPLVRDDIVTIVRRDDLTGRSLTQQ